MTAANVDNYNSLLQRKLEIENRISELSKFLENEGNVGMKGNLMDSEGFPRSDIDIYNIRLARQEINCLQNDYKELMNQIEKYLVNVNTDESQRPNLQNLTLPTKNLEPFLKITHVDRGSPASDAGLQINDVIVQFGPFTCLNIGKSLSEIGDLVKEKKEKIILLNVSRLNATSEIESIKIKLIPKDWHGNGLLGCKLEFIK